MICEQQVRLGSSIGAMTVGCGLLIASLAIKPPGEISHSVLVAFGEICTFSGTLLAIPKKRKGEKSEFERKIDIYDKRP